MHHRYRKDQNSRALAAIALGVAAGALLLVCSRSMLRARGVLQPEDSPPHTWRRHIASSSRWGATVGRTITINRPREDVYARWRDFARFPEFMENVRSVTPLDAKRSRWVVAAPGGGSVTFETTITEERPNELIAWQSDENSEIRNSGRVLFRDAPHGRGTQVEAIITYEPPGGTLGRVAAKILQREPGIQARRELKRFKQLMETGEVTTAAARNPMPSD